MPVLIGAMSLYIYRPPGIVAVTALTLLVGCSEEWRLGVRLGASREDVHERLGSPTETVDRESQERLGSQHKIDTHWDPRIVEEYYYSEGLNAEFRDGRLASLTIWRYSPYKGWLTHEGPIIGKVAITDDIATVVNKLGPPTKVEEDKDMPAGVDRTVPVVWNPATATYYWKRSGYTITVVAMRQAQSLNEAKHEVAAVNSLESIRLSR